MIKPYAPSFAAVGEGWDVEITKRQEALVQSRTRVPMRRNLVLLASLALLTLPAFPALHLIQPRVIQSFDTD